MIYNVYLVCSKCNGLIYANGDEACHCPKEPVYEWPEKVVSPHKFTMNVTINDIADEDNL